MAAEPILILGAGAAGLAAAHELVQRGQHPIVCEARSRVGGIARTESYQGFSFDVGGHRFFTMNGRIDQLWRDMMGADFLKVSRLSRIYYQGRFFQYPLSLPNTVANLGLVESVCVALSYGQARLRPHPEEDNVEQWVSNRFGRRLYETFFRTYTEKVWGIPCSRIQADWAAQRIKGLSLAAAVTTALWGGRKAKSLIDEFDYPREGPGMMWERFRDAVERRGGEVRCGCEAVRLTHEGRRVTSVGLQSGGSVLDVAAAQVISSVPIHRLVGLLQPSAPPAVLAAASRLTYRSLLVVGLVVNRAELFPDQWIYVHSPEVRVGRIQNFRNWSAAMAPDPAQTNLGMEYFCDEGDELWRLPDSALRDLATRELGALGLAKTEDVADSFVVRQADAYPIYDRGYKGHLNVIREYLGGFENLQTIGRAGMHRYNNMDHSMLTGILAAENVLGARHDLWEVNEEEEYLEGGPREQALPSGSEVLVAQTLGRLDKFALATAVGAASGLALFLATLWLVVKGGTVVGPNLSLLSQYFVGYTVTVRGSFVAFGYSFAWGFLFGWFLAYTRNLAVAFYVLRVKRKSASVSLAKLLDQV